MSAAQQAAADRAAAMLDLHHAAVMLGSQPELIDATADEIERMPLDQFARIRERAGLVRPAPHVVDDTPANPVPAVPGAVTAQNPEHSTEAPDFSAMDWETYSEYRKATGIDRRSNEGATHARVSMSGRMTHRTNY